MTEADNKDRSETWPQEGVSLENDPVLLLQLIVDEELKNEIRSAEDALEKAKAELNRAEESDRTGPFRMIIYPDGMLPPAREAFNKARQREILLKKAQHAAYDQFYDRMARDHSLRATGRRNNPAADPSEIPSFVWQRIVRVLDWQQPVLVERDTHTVWYDVRVRRVEPPVTAALPAPKLEAPPKQSRKKGLHQKPAQLRAQKMLDQMFPDGCPKEMSNKELLALFEVEWAKLKAKAPAHAKPSTSSILRAIGRMP